MKDLELMDIETPDEDIDERIIPDTLIEIEYSADAEELKNNAITSGLLPPDILILALAHKLTSESQRIGELKGITSKEYQSHIKLALDATKSSLPYFSRKVDKPKEEGYDATDIVELLTAYNAGNKDV